MAAAFGFSTGDIIMGINLVRDIIKALNESRGSSKEYLEVICELRGLEVALVYVKSQHSLPTQSGQIRALHLVVKECETTIEDFLKSLEKYNGHLSIFGTKIKWKDAVRKVQWHLCKADELTSFRLRIASHVQNIEMMLATLQASAISLSTKSAQAHEREMQYQSGALSGLADSMTMISQSFDDLKSTWEESGTQYEQVLTKIEGMKRMMISQHLQVLDAISQNQNSIPPQILLQKPVIFLDALDRLAPFHLEWIDSHEAFLAVLKIRFKDHGHQMIESRRFALQASKTKKDVDLNRPWKICLFPGQEYDMSMLFRDPNSDHNTKCMACHHICPGKADEDIICENCHTTFRRVFEMDDEDSDPHEAFSNIGHTISRQSKKRRRDESEEVQHQDKIQDFRRIRLVCKRRQILSYSTIICYSCNRIIAPSEYKGSEYLRRECSQCRDQRYIKSIDAYIERCFKAPLSASVRSMQEALQDIPSTAGGLYSVLAQK